MRPFRFGWSASILLALVSYGLGGVANAQPAGAPPAAPPPAAEPAPMAPPPAETVPPPAPYAPVTPAIALAPPMPPPPATAPIQSVSPLKIEGPNGSIRFGMFLQPQFESAQVPTANGYANNLYLRRARIIIGGTLFDRIEYFMETDSPNLFKGNQTPPAAGQQALKTTSTMVIQDMFGTFKFLGDMVKIDAGYTLPAGSHNSMQSAFTLFGWDYFAYTFNNNLAFGAATNPVGRDLGFQLRGLLVDKHLEYRVGLWQGQRNAAIAGVMGPPAVPGEQGARNFFRTAARLQINIFDPETGYYYGGTYLGAKKILSVGGSYDFQSDYKAYSADGFLDMPLGPGVVTAQVDYSHWDGGTYLPLPKQWAVQGEAGYTFLPVGIAPIVRVEHERIDTTNTTQNRYAGGLAYWCYGHNSNVKIFYTRIQQDNALHGANQVNLQWQIFVY
jgi:hypothetical protein